MGCADDRGQQAVGSNCQPSFHDIWARVKIVGRHCVVATCAAANVCLLDAAVSAQSGTTARRPVFGTCDREAPKLVGEKAVRVGVGKKVPAPRKLRNVMPKYPNDWASRRVKGVPWVGEVLIGADGKVERIWTLREVEATPPWPEFNQAITTAIGQWLFEPTVVEGRHVPVCMAVTVGIVLQ